MTTWGVVHRLGRANRLRLIVEDVPEKLGAPSVRRVLEAAGYAATFSEGGIAWANHRLVAEDRWPPRLERDPAGVTRTTWQHLEAAQEGRTLSVRVSAAEYATIALAASRAGEKLYPWCRHQLVEAAEVTE